MNKRASVVRSEWILMAMVGLLPLLWVPVSQGQTTSITSSGLNTRCLMGQPTELRYHWRHEAWERHESLP